MTQANTGHSKLPGNGTLPLRIGNLIDTYVHGGPYKNKPHWMYGVKLAPEVKTPCDVLVPVPDFSVPKTDDLRAGIVKALMAMMIDKQVYVGCFGGWGRTGIFLSVLTKVQVEYRKSKHRAGRDVDPVGYVRSNYSERAVETSEQEEFIDNFDVSEIVNWLTVTQRAIYGSGEFLLNRIGGEGDMVLSRATVTPAEVVVNVDDYVHDSAAGDWMENGGDSAGNLVDPIEQTPAELQWQIDDLLTKHSETERKIRNNMASVNSRLKFFETYCNSRFRSMVAALKLLQGMHKELIKPSWYERIRRTGNWFDK